MRERPWLAPEIFKIFNAYPCLFHHFPAHGLFNALACLDKPGDDTVDPRREPWGTCKKYRILPLYEDNRCRRYWWIVTWPHTGQVFARSVTAQTVFSPHAPQYCVERSKSTILTAKAAIPRVQSGRSPNRSLTPKHSSYIRKGCVFRNSAVKQGDFS